MGDPQLDAAVARSAWRVRARWLSVVGGAATAANYLIVRADGAGCSVLVASAFAVDALTIELALTEPLTPDVVYVLGFAGDGGAPQFAFRRPVPQAVGALPDDDPEAEAFGVDFDWLAPALDATGDLPRVRGRDCLAHDLAAIAVTVPGELFHRPDAGAGLPARVNGVDTPGALATAVRREWTRDDRVAQATATATVATTGDVSVRGDVTPRALDTQLSVTVRASG